MEKILSIIIPTYNAEKFLDKGLPTYILDSEHMQKLEVLVINDGTPDRSVEVAQKYVDQYPQVFRIVNKENGGHGSAINEGVKHATGKYFKVVDADDWVNTNILQKFIDRLERMDVDAVLSSYESFDIQDKVFYPKEVQVDAKDEKSDGYYGPYSLKQVIDHWNDFYWGLTFHGIIYNTSFYKSLNYRLVEKVFYEDQEYAAVPMAFAHKVAVMPDKLYVYRVGDVNQSVSFQSSLKRLDHYEAVILRMASMQKYLEQFAPGGAEYWKRKTSKFANDYYQLCLIRNTNKKQCRKRLLAFNKKLEQKGPVIYGCTRKTFSIFWLLNHLHVNEEGYQKKVLPLIHKVRKNG